MIFFFALWSQPPRAVQVCQQYSVGARCGKWSIGLPVLSKTAIQVVSGGWMSVADGDDAASCSSDCEDFKILNPLEENEKNVVTHFGKLNIIQS